MQSGGRRFQRRGVGIGRRPGIVHVIQRTIHTPLASCTPCDYRHCQCQWNGIWVAVKQREGLSRGKAPFRGPLDVPVGVLRLRCVPSRVLHDGRVRLPTHPRGLGRKGAASGCFFSSCSLCLYSKCWGLPPQWGDPRSRLSVGLDGVPGGLSPLRNLCQHVRVRNGRRGDDPAWEGTPPEGGRKKKDPALVTRLREHFWRQMDSVPLSVPRWDSIPRMNANMKWLLDGDKEGARPPIPEDILRASFEYFRNDVDSLDLSPQVSCWSVYFARRVQYLRAAGAAQAGARGEGRTQQVGDIAVDQQPKKRRRIIRRDQ